MSKPLSEGCVYKCVYSSWTDVCLLVSACLSAYASAHVGGINKGILNIRGSKETVENCMDGCINL